MTEAPLTRAEGGWLEPAGDGWYVLNAQDAKWLASDELGAYTNFEGSHQEGFLILSGEALLIPKEAYAPEPVAVPFREDFLPG
jgi:hypothetical protein